VAFPLAAGSLRQFRHAAYGETDRPVPPLGFHSRRRTGSRHRAQNFPRYRKRDNDRHKRGGKRRGLFRGPRARGIEHDGVVAFHLLRAERARKKIAPRGCHLMHAFDVRGFRHGLKRCLIEIVGIDFRESRHPQRKGPDAGKRSAMSLAPAACAQTRAASVSSPASVACKNAPGGGATMALPMASTGVRREIRIEPWFENARDHSPRQSDKSLRRGIAHRTMAFEIDIEA